MSLGLSCGQTYMAVICLESWLYYFTASLPFLRARFPLCLTLRNTLYTQQEDGYCGTFTLNIQENEREDPHNLKTIINTIFLYLRVKKIRFQLPLSQKLLYIMAYLLICFIFATTLLSVCITLDHVRSLQNINENYI